MQMSLAGSQDLSKICWRVENLFYCVTGVTKTVRGISQLWFNHSRLIFFNELGIHSSWEA